VLKISETREMPETAKLDTLLFLRAVRWRSPGHGTASSDRDCNSLDLLTDHLLEHYRISGLVRRTPPSTLLCFPCCSQTQHYRISGLVRHPPSTLGCLPSWP